MWALALTVLSISAAVCFILLQKSAEARDAWLPSKKDGERWRVEAAGMVHDAHGWYVAAKQQTDPAEALVRCSYGLALMRCVQSSVRLDDLRGLHLPATVDGATGLLDDLSEQQSQVLRSMRRHGRAPSEEKKSKPDRSMFFRPLGRRLAPPPSTDDEDEELSEESESE